MNTHYLPLLIRSVKIDKFFVEAMETIITAGFLNQSEKLSYVRLAIRKTDTLKIFLMILWETKSLDNKKYITSLWILEKPYVHEGTVQLLHTISYFMLID